MKGSHVVNSDNLKNLQDQNAHLYYKTASSYLNIIWILWHIFKQYLQVSSRQFHLEFIKISKKHNKIYPVLFFSFILAMVNYY